jgi:RimJ/RimL family protein N-acetyltransferase
MASNNESIQIEAHSNPHSDRFLQEMFSDPIEFFNHIVDERRAREARYDYDPDPLEDYEGTWDNSGEFFQRIYPNFILKTPDLDKWHYNIVTWMPPDVQSWWFKQFKNENNSHLDSMPREWWRLRTRNLLVARDQDNNNRPVGAAALTMVYISERKQFEAHMPENAGPFCYEIRGLVIDDAYRGQGIAQELTRAALLQATLEQPVRGRGDEYYRIPTVAMTTNPVAAKIFEELGATDKPSKSKGFLYDSYNDVLCWSRRSETNRGMGDRKLVCSGENPPPCDICPKRKKTALWFPTNDSQLMDELGIFGNDRARK